MLIPLARLWIWIVAKMSYLQMSTHGQRPRREYAEARLHATLRFAIGVTAAFVLCEFMEWTPTFLAPVLTAVLLANLPMRPPLKLAWC